MKTTMLFIIFLWVFKTSATAQINRHTRPVENNLQKHSSSDTQTEILALQLESDKLKSIASSYKQYYKAIESFKPSKDGTFKAVVVIDESLKMDCLVTVFENKIYKLIFKRDYDASDGLKVTSQVNNAHSKVFLELDGRMVPIDVYIPEFFL